MKNKYIIYFFAILTIVIFATLYMIEIPSPSTIITEKYTLNIKVVKASNLNFKKLNNVHNPEKKRKIIGNLFIKIFEKEAKKFKKVKFLAQC